jgi:hypothetical protein
MDRQTDRRDLTHKGFGSGERPQGLLVDALDVAGHHGQGTSLGEHHCFVREICKTNRDFAIGLAYNQEQPQRVPMNVLLSLLMR